MIISRMDPKKRLLETVQLSNDTVRILVSTIDRQAAEMTKLANAIVTLSTALALIDAKRKEAER